jgi:transposase-like protein
MGRPSRYSPEFRQRAVRLVLEQRQDYPSEFEAIRSIAGKFGIGSAETLRKWVRGAEVDAGARSRDGDRLHHRAQGRPAARRAALGCRALVPGADRPRGGDQSVDLLGVDGPTAVAAATARRRGGRADGYGAGPVGFVFLIASEPTPSFVGEGDAELVFEHDVGEFRTHCGASARQGLGVVLKNDDACPCWDQRAGKRAAVGSQEVVTCLTVEVSLSWTTGIPYSDAKP